MKAFNISSWVGAPLTHSYLPKLENTTSSKHVQLTFEFCTYILHRKELNK